MASPRKYALYSIAASIFTLVLKFGAWYLTDSVGLLSDATEALVNLTAGVLALSALTIALQPADESHAYGHGKAEYFSSAAEGLLILVAAGGILYASLNRFLHPVLLSDLWLGMGVAIVAAGINWVTAIAMLRAARRFDSITLEADAKHLLTDVWTSAGMVAGLLVMALAPPSWQVLDPIIGCVMAVNIAITGVNLLRRSAGGLMDAALPEEEVQLILAAIKEKAGENAVFHGLRTRKAGSGRFVDFHLLLPGATTVKESHDLSEAIEKRIRQSLPRCHVTVHFEPVEDHRSWDGWAVGGICSGCSKEGKKD
ncbi:MAG: cation diffusion facilitator family transporter [Desulfovibrionaceae bacterium]